MSCRGVCFKFCYEEVAVIVVVFSISCFGEWKIFVNRDGAVKRYYNAENLEKNDDIFSICEVISFSAIKSNQNISYEAY